MNNINMDITGLIIRCNQIISIRVSGCPRSLLLLENIWPHIVLSSPRGSSAATIPISPFERRKERINGAGRLALGDETKSDTDLFRAVPRP